MIAMTTNNSMSVKAERLRATIAQSSNDNSGNETQKEKEPVRKNLMKTSDGNNAIGSIVSRDREISSKK